MQALRLAILFTVAVLFVLSLSAQAPNWLWATGVEGSCDDHGNFIVVDDFGNHYITGNYSGTVSLGTFVLTSQHQNSKYIAKLSPAGDYLWAVGIGANTLSISGIDLDGSSNLYLTGSFKGSLNIGSSTLHSYNAETSSVYIAKLSADGVWVWANSASGYYNDYPSDIAVTRGGFCYITGRYNGDLTMGNLSLGGASQNSAFFLAKANINGQWELLIGNSDPWSQSSWGNTLSINDNMDLFVTAYFRNGSFFGQNSTYGAMFIGKFSSNGVLLWSGIANEGQWGSITSRDSYFDQNGRLILTGNFRGDNISFMGWGLTGDNGPRSNIYVVSISEMGSVQWVRTVGSMESNDQSYALYVDNESDIFITGTFENSVSFGSTTLTSDEERTPYIAKISSAGDWLYAMSFDAGPIGKSLDLTYFGDSIYIIGSYSGTMILDSIILNSSGEEDTFVAKLGYYPITASFEATPTFGGYPLEVVFSDTSIYGNAYISDWLWDFGDGHTSALQNPVHIYQNPGLYSVSLTITNFADSCNTYIAENLVSVVNPQPELVANYLEAVHFPSTSIGSTSGNIILSITNTGFNPLVITNITLENQTSAFSFDVEFPISIIYGDHIDIELSFSPITLGVNQDVLTISNNSENYPCLELVLTGQGALVPLKAPQDLSISILGNNAQLNWEAVTQNINNEAVSPDYYFVWINGDSAIGHPFHFLALTTDTSYTHWGVGLGASHMFYKVTAYKSYRDGQGVLEFGTIVTPGMSEIDVFRALHRYENDL